MSIDLICASMFIVFVALPAAIFYVYVGIFLTGAWNGFKVQRSYRRIA